MLNKDLAHRSFYGAIKQTSLEVVLNAKMLSTFDYYASLS